MNITRRDEMCMRVHMDVQELIIAGAGLLDRLFIPLITEEKAEAVCVANYLRGMGYKVKLHEEMKGFFYEICVEWV